MRGFGISILADLRAGHVGQDSMTVLVRVVGSQLRRLPAAYADQRHAGDLVSDVVQDFCAERWDRTSSELLTKATDDESVEKLLHRIVGNWLIDKARQTDRGSVGKTLKKHLAANDAFEEIPAKQPGAGRWRLAGTSEPPWGGNLDDLVVAARGVRAATIRWNHPTRRAPITSPADLTAVLCAVMEAAVRQSLSEQQLVEVIVRRFPATLATPVGALDPDVEQVGDTKPSPDLLFEAGEDAAAVADAANAVFTQLTAAERHLLRLMAAGKKSVEVSSDVQAYLGCGRSTAYTRMEQVKGLVRELAGAGDDAEQVGREVLDLCNAEGVTAAPAVDEPGDGSSVPGEEPPPSARSASS